MADYYVSPDGNDSWTGTHAAPLEGRKDGPFASLQRARDAVRSAIRDAKERSGSAREVDGSDTEIVVQIRGGTYTVDKTVLFGPKDSGSDEISIVYEAYPGETPVLSGGREIGSWRKLNESESPPSGMSKAAAEQVWMTDISTGFGDFEYFRTLYGDNGLLPRARSDGFVPLKSNDGDTDPLLQDGRVIRLPLDTWAAIGKHENIEDIELRIVPKYPWFFDILPLESADESAGTARTKWPASYPMEPVQFLLKSGEPSAWIENSFAALTGPGEWVLDGKNKRLYLWPVDGRPGSDIRAPGLCELLRIQGNEEPERIVSHLTFRGLTFTHGDRYVPDDGRRYAYAMREVSNALVRISGASRCTIESCRFAHSGDTGLRLDAYCTYIRVLGNSFEHLGGVGLMLCGHRELTKPDVNKFNEIADNDIHDCGEIQWSATGLFVQQSGENHIHHNSIHDQPHNGIMLGGLTAPSTEELLALGIDPPDGHPDPVEAYRRALRFIPSRNNIVEYNEVYRVMKRLGDGNGMYINGAGSGNIVRRNYFHDITGYGCQSALRTDDHQSGTIMRENLIFRCVGGGITLKQINDIQNNIIACLLPKTLPDGTATPPDGYILLRRGPSDRSKIQHNILYHEGSGIEFYCEGKIKRWPLAYARDCATDYNLYFCTDDVDFCEKFLDRKQSEKIDAHSLAADPLFENLHDGNFKLRSDSPVTAIDFQPFPLDDFGPREPQR